ncbi:PLP-dependent aminotransferase family protein [Taklimakanibacter albus]|uniref:PLP-dependent aminotransferase family protein n=1 Tax=Taklimakanibacter albus TaxID=2800327 RepID=A0ACC5RFU8_9HYPH|nr:PLP-dependent aminotransferase family protein [Aestuariivirga sp. YIM B02566]MBK1871522.1 PLP-dependent aminotransferase family protein [Aestuariivirga sp. YIM B02566]
MDWTPTLSEWSGPIYLRLVEALGADIAHGRLARGQQLPTQRALSQALDIDLTTVTRAYGEARRRGLIEARVGQGTFVSETTARSAQNIPFPVKIDLSMNVPPQPVEANLDMRIAKGFASIQSTASFSAFLNYQRPGGSDEEREVAASWLRARLPEARTERVIIYPGNQAILFNALLSLTSPGDVVLTEALTYPGIKAAAAKLGVRLIGVEMDKEGVLPDALAGACRRHRPKAVYLTPTQHNPTTATLGPERRRAVARIIDENATFLIEDDAYGPLEPIVTPIARLIPERTYLAAGLSKCIAPALRVSFLLAPNAAAEQAMRSTLQATSQMPPRLMVALVIHWLKTGTAEQIIQAIRNEASGRQQLASRILKGVSFASRPNAHHLWLSLPRHWNASGFASHILRAGLAVVESDAFALDQPAPQAVRVSLGAARNRAELAQALQLLAAAVDSPISVDQIV